MKAVSGGRVKRSIAHPGLRSDISSAIKQEVMATPQVAIGSHLNSIIHHEGRSP
jgi:hypothetical protein